MSSLRFDSIKTPTVRFKPAGRCIYCGSTDVDLKQEHILPFGIAHNSLVLPASSCAACEKVTCGIENDVLGKQMIQMRTALKSPTRNKKKRATGFTLFRAFSQDGSFQDSVENAETISAEDYPWHYTALLMDKAGFLAGSPRFEPLRWELFSVGKPPPDQHNVGPKAAVATRVGQINPYSFARFLAKVAHSYACAYYGGIFEPVLLDLIRGQTDGAFRYWIGGDLSVQSPQPGHLHHLSLQRVQRGGATYLVVVIHLFRMLGTPVYHVVAGRLRHSPDTEASPAQYNH